MNRITWAAAALAALGAAGCADVSKQDVESVKAELLANDTRMANELKRELVGIDQKYVTVQQLQLKVEKQLEDGAKLNKELQDLGKRLDERSQIAASQVLKALQFEEKLMSERLAELRLLIEELKKK
jgi:hypothetical protein